MKILAGYLAAINFGGLIIMALGRRNRKEEKKVLLSRAIWIISFLGGSIGTLAGMYLYHHKDRKLKYVIGLPLILFLQLALILFGRSYLKERNARPSSVVDRQLARIQDLDSDAALQVISYQNLTAPESEKPLSESGTLPDGAVSAISRFFKDFHYRIDDTVINGDEADVTVTITNLDAHALAQDICRSLSQRSARDPDKARTPLSTEDYFDLLDSTLAEGTYEAVSREVHIPLDLKDGVWTIRTDEQFQDDLLGGFISYINDPYLVDAGEILEIYLKQFGEMDGEEWLSYLGRSDIFSTYSANYADELDALYTEKIAENLSFSVDSCETNGSQATATVTLNSLDLTHVLEMYNEKLLSYAGSVEATTSGNAEKADAMAKYLIEAFEEGSGSASHQVNITLKNDGRSWTPVFTQEISNIFLGDIDGALEKFIEEQESELSE